MLSDDSVLVSRSERVERRDGRVPDAVDDGRGIFEGDAGGSTAHFPRSFFWMSVMAYFVESTLFFAIVVVGGLQSKMMKIFAQSQSRFSLVRRQSRSTPQKIKSARAFCLLTMVQVLRFRCFIPDASGTRGPRYRN
jgi:hypothetical protein